MRRLQCALLATVAAIGFASIASAADMPVKARPMAPLPVVYNWTGFYVGLQAGYGWQDPTYTYTVIPESTAFKANGFVGGGTLGYNWQAGMWVLGAEVDLSFADVKGSINTVGAAVPTTPCLIAGEGCTAKLSWFGTGRARLGYAMGDFLPYITGGAAVGHVKGTADLGACGFTPTCSFDQTRWGWTGGGGFEYRFAGNWSAKLEYLHMNLGTPTFTTATVTTTNLKYNIVRGGLNFHF